MQTLTTAIHDGTFGARYRDSSLVSRRYSPPPDLVAGAVNPAERHAARRHGQLRLRARWFRRRDHGGKVPSIDCAVALGRDRASVSMLERHAPGREIRVMGSRVGGQA